MDTIAKNPCVHFIIGILAAIMVWYYGLPPGLPYLNAVAACILAGAATYALVAGLAYVTTNASMITVPGVIAALICAGVYYLVVSQSIEGIMLVAVLGIGGFIVTILVFFETFSIAELMGSNEPIRYPDE